MDLELGYLAFGNGYNRRFKKSGYRIVAVRDLPKVEA